MNQKFVVERLCRDNVKETLSLWKNIFTEDSDSFVQYYYDFKAANNITFVCREQERLQIVGMLHLTPYKFTSKVLGTIDTYYIVGVATSEKYRHQGCMSMLMQIAIKFCQNKNLPFVYLMPAAVGIYEPFGFEFITNRNEYQVPNLLLNCSISDYCNKFRLAMNTLPSANFQIKYFTSNAITTNLLSKLSEIASLSLSLCYDYYVNRSVGYYENLFKELESENGGIFCLYENNILFGFFTYAREENVHFIQECFLPDNYCPNTIKHCLEDYIPCITNPKSTYMALNITKNEQIDYVNFLSTHKGYLSELV